LNDGVSLEMVGADKFVRDVRAAVMLVD